MQGSIRVCMRDIALHARNDQSLCGIKRMRNLEAEKIFPIFLGRRSQVLFVRGQQTKKGDSAKAIRTDSPNDTRL